MRQFERVLVTVGTTRFDALVDEVTADCYEALQSVGCRVLSVQYGTGSAPDVVAARVTEDTAVPQVVPLRPLSKRCVAGHRVIV
jgi:UDP-N-acetylglucosamine transferase subunit ALG13